MTIVEPYIAKCFDCETIFRFSSRDIHDMNEAYKYGTILFDCLDGFVVCPNCGELVLHWDKSMSTNVNTYCVDILYARCLQDAVAEVCANKLTTKEVDKIYSLASEKFHNALSWKEN